jgi:hypothetical protein
VGWRTRRWRMDGHISSKPCPLLPNHKLEVDGKTWTSFWIGISSAACGFCQSLCSLCNEASKVMHAMRNSVRLSVFPCPHTLRWA